MIGMTMSDDRAWYGPDRIDNEIAENTA